MAKVKHVITAYKAQMNPQVNGVIDIFGEFDNLIQPMFPFPMANLSVVVTVTDLQRPTRPIWSRKENFRFREIFSWRKRKVYNRYI